MSVQIKPLVQIVNDATLLQKQAADPNSSVWVMASAGTGKTTVLVERFIRLVLTGTYPDKILCLTYTKAAATQMKERILKRVGQWVRMEENALSAELAGILQEEPSTSMIRKARNLMGDLLDQIDRLNILTIHAFCQSLLARFQLEAGLSGGLDVMEDWVANDIFSGILQSMLENDDSPYIEQLVHIKAESEWTDLLKMIVNDRLKFHAALAGDTNIEKQINDALRLSASETEDECRTQAMRDMFINRDVLLCLAEAYPKTALSIERVLQSSADDRGSLFDDYAQIFLTKDLEPRKIKNLKNDPVQSQIPFEQARLQNVYDQLRRIRTRDMSLCLSYLARQALQSYTAYKEKQGVLDYQDLIERTVALLSLSDAKDWIRYKLDGGIDQVLVDEAQDTNPLQWHIIAKLIEEYFTGLGTHEDIERTLFVVGDTKQSIYSFQGADPETANTYHGIFKQAAIEARKDWRDVPLNTSFRTAQDILDIVDACSAWGKTLHKAGKDLPGRVECWPLIEAEKTEEKETPWTLPSQASVKAQRLMVDKTADHIKSLLDRNVALPSKKNKAIEAQDILVLVQNRNHYPTPLIQALRKRNVPVAGIDSFCLTDDIAVQDVLSLLNWSLFPDDDLALAEILKSPFVGFDDNALGMIAKHRGSVTLWEKLREHHGDIAQWLSHIRRMARRQQPAHVIQTLLEMPCPSARSGYKAMQGRLGPASLDALEQLLSYARGRDIEDRNVLRFLKHLTVFAPTIKREMEGENAAGVRIMTLHGAKGLEAPVVYMIDTLQERSFLQKTSDLQWLEHGDMLLPLWAPRKDDRAPELTELKEAQAAKLQAESYRLLYVGMTRAKDYLVIGGAGKANEDETDWFGQVRCAMRSMNAMEEDGVLSYGQWSPVQAGETATPLHTTTDTSFNAAVWPMPDEEEPDTLIESGVNDNRARVIGRQWHKLLERAIDRSDEDWSAHLVEWMDDLPDIGEDIARGRLHALRGHSEYGFLFQPGGAAEVPFITRAETIIRGRIDRLVVRDDALWIIDYKTRLNPGNAARMEAYQQQLAGYRAALAPLTNGKPVRTLLVDIAEARIIEV